MENREVGFVVNDEYKAWIEDIKKRIKQKDAKDHHTRDQIHINFCSFTLFDYFFHFLLLLMLLHVLLFQPAEIKYFLL